MPYELTGRYPHLLPADKEIWERYIAKYPTAFSAVSYDFHVGSGVDTAGDLDPNIRYMAETLTKKRIDVLGWDELGVVIIELKPDAGITAIGQVLCYRELLKKENPGLADVRMRIVTDRIFEDSKFLCARFGIDLVAV